MTAHDPTLPPRPNAAPIGYAYDDYDAPSCASASRSSASRSSAVSPAR